MQKKITTIKDMFLIKLTAIGVSIGGLLFFVISHLLNKRSSNRTIDQLITRNQKRFDEKIKRNNADIDNAPIEELLEDGEYIQERRKQN